MRGRFSVCVLFVVLLGLGCGGEKSPTKPPAVISADAPALVDSLPNVDLIVLGIATAPDGTIYLGGDPSLGYHPRFGVQVYSSDGTVLNWLSPDWATSLAYGPDGNLYVTEYGENTARGVFKMKTDGTLLDYWAGRGSAEGQFAWGNKGIASGPDGLLYICDTGNNRVQVFRTDGTFVRQFGNSGEEPGHLSAPRGIAVSKDGDVYVADAGKDRVVVFRTSGAYVRSWGGNGTGDGLFSDPHGVAVGPDGAVYVADTGNSRVQKFKPEGEFLVAWSRGSGSLGFLRHPEAIAVDAVGRVLVPSGDGIAIYAYP